MKHQCPVCGFPDLTEAPRSKSGGGSYEICPGCGFEFGVSDDDEGISYEQWRAKWVRNGMKWSSARPQPKSWNASANLAKLPGAKPASTKKPTG